MAKHKLKKLKKPKQPKHRNNSGGGAATRPPRRSARRYLPKRGDPPDFWTTVAAVAGGAGSAVLSGLVVNQKILSPEASAIGMIGIGGATAFFADGNTRVVGNSMASAGAGQLALALMGRRALAQSPPLPAVAQPAPQAQPQLPAPQAQPAPPQARPANSNTGGGYVLDVFRDAANHLDMLDEDQWRMGTRDDADGAADVYDLDDLAVA